MAALNGDVEDAIRAAMSSHPVNDIGPFPGIREATAGGPRRRRVVVACVVAVALIGVATGLAIWVRPTTGEPSPAATTRSNRDLASDWVNDTVARSPVPPGARPSDQAPVPVLGGTRTQVMSPNLVSSHLWWTSDDPPASVVHYLSAHPPAGMQFTGPETGGGEDLPMNVLLFAPTTTASAIFEPQSLVISVVPFGRGSAARVQAEAIWLPVRTPATLVPDPVTGVTVVRSRDNARAVVGPSDALTLARAINALPVEVPAVRSCPGNGRAGPDYTLRFSGSSRPTLVTVAISGCPHVEFQLDGVTQAPTLAGATSLATRIDAVLGR